MAEFLTFYEMIWGGVEPIEEEVVSQVPPSPGWIPYENWAALPGEVESEIPPSMLPADFQQYEDIPHEALLGSYGPAYKGSRCVGMCGVLRGLGQIVPPISSRTMNWVLGIAGAAVVASIAYYAVSRRK
jgi:hypothetical protein